MRKILALVFLASVLLIACQPTQKATVKTDQGEVVIEGKAGADDWCQTGAKWKSTSTESTANMVIQGIVSSGKYAGYCHVKYEAASEQGQANMDLYFDKEGNGYQIMVVNGQTFESEWTG